MNHRFAHLSRLMDAVKAAPVPMPEEIVDALREVSPFAIHNVLRVHPGFALWELSKSYQASYEVFGLSFDHLFQAIDRFEAACRDGLLFAPGRDAEVTAFERVIQKELFAAANAAHSLIDHSTRKLQPEAQIPGYTGQLQAAFGSDGLHETVIGLRNILHHFHVLRPMWQWAKEFKPGAEMEYSFKIDRDNLLRVAAARKEKLSNFARIKAYLSAAPSMIDIRLLFAAYRERAAVFHSWLSNALEGDLFAAARDYERCLKENKKVTARAYWHAMLGNWLAWDTPPNPYEHLDKYLTAEQRAEVCRLPMGSPEQVDRVIAFLDVDGACDDHIRKQAYELFRRAAKPSGAA